MNPLCNRKGRSRELSSYRRKKNRSYSDVRNMLPSEVSRSHSSRADGGMKGRTEVAAKGDLKVRKTRAIQKRAGMLKPFVEVGDGIPELDEEDGTLAAENIPMPEFETTLMERVVERGNMVRAYKRVMSNKGAAGVDNVSVDELKTYVGTHWDSIKRALLGGTYTPQAVRMVEIPKANGGKRQLGIPTVIDRLIQQAVQQVLSPIFEPAFSESSYGFRPKRNAHMAIRQAQKYQREGRRWVVDMDLAQFFDEVNHARLMSRIENHVRDRHVLTLIRRYLRAGIMAGGMTSQRQKGTPQGSPLSPLLSNIVLDELDKELERRRLKYCRYADDCNVYVRSKKAAEHVMASVKEYVETRLRLKVNEKKSVVSRPWKRRFLGYSFSVDKQTKIRVAPETVMRLRAKLRMAFREGRGRNIGNFIRERIVPMLRGWIVYFRLAEVKQFAETLDEWIRRRLRLLIWRQWKRPRTRYMKLKARGLNEKSARLSAYNGRGAWWNSGASHMNKAFPNQYFDNMGLLSLLRKWDGYKTFL